MRDSNKGRLDRAIRWLRERYPDAQSREAVIRDDDTLVLTVEGVVVAQRRGRNGHYR